MADLLDLPALLDDRNIVLTGFMGTGKTTVGAIVADRLGYDVVDTDAVIVGRHGPIPEIFATGGEAAFRSLEREVAAELADRSRLVIATGGRMVLDPVNAVALGDSGVIVCLCATVETLLDRLLAGGTDDRPLLAGDDPAGTIAALLAERAAGYGRFPGVDTDDLGPEEVADRVLATVLEACARSAGGPPLS